MPNKTKVTLSFKKVFLITLCVLLGIVFYKIRQAHLKLPALIRTALADLNLEKEGLELTFAKASLTLVGSFSHPVGLRLKDLKAEYVKGCSLYSLELETLVLPVKLIPLFKHKKINLGLIRSNDALLKQKRTCESQAQNTNNNKVSTKKKSRLESKISTFFGRLKKLNLDIIKQSQALLKYKGFLLYDLRIEMSEVNKIHVNRFKVLRGLGELKYKAEWDAELIVDQSKASVKGKLVGYENSMESEVFFREKESLLKANITSYSDLEKADKLLLNFKSVPLSYLSKLKKTGFAGLNLRKAWLDSALDVEVTKKSLRVKFKNFKIYGDFGLVETDVNSPELLWKNNLWALQDTTQLKLQKINFFEILAKRPQKRIAQVFKDVGRFNALVKLESLDEFNGDFETYDFSVTVRSRGRKAYQVIKFARGSVSYMKKQNLTFNLEDIGLEKGGFEGYLKFIYDYERKEIRAQFDVQYLKFDPVVTKKILGLKETQEFSIEGKGFISKKNLTKETKNNYQSALAFKLKTSELSTEHWLSKGVESVCSLKNRLLGCQFTSDHLFISGELQKKLKLRARDFKSMKSTAFIFQNKSLNAKLKNPEQTFNINWSGKEGLGVSTPDSAEVLLRQL